MIVSTRLQLLTCLLVYATSAHAIMVKFGTKGGPIEPPPPEPPQPQPQPGRVPAPVWEERFNDNPDPNAQWRPRLFVPQPRYTQIAFNFQDPTPRTINNAQTFANSYIPQHKPIQAQQNPNYFTPAQILSSQSLPGFGIRYFFPAYLKELENRKQLLRQEDAQLNQIDTNEVGGGNDSPNDAQWKYEKDSTRNTRQTPTPYPYQFPVYIAHRQQ